MQLPTSLLNAIEKEASAIGLRLLTQAASELSDRYRHKQHSTGRFIVSAAHRLAYAATRMPATFAAVSAVLAEVRRLAPELKPESLLDLGAGTGAAAWAAAETFDRLRQITLIEQDSQLIELGGRLTSGSGNQTLRSASWYAANLRTTPEFAPHDLVICSYSLGEIEAALVSRIVKAAWQAAQKILIVIEPGTMNGFQTVLSARNRLIESGGFIVAPCPHQNACPLAAGDWCHFAQRFERSSLHRPLKGGTRGYEDEKFSYVAVAKHPVEQASARVLRHPLRHAGHTQLQLCTPEGLQNITITKRDKENWRRARKAGWGDAWDAGPD